MELNSADLVTSGIHGGSELALALSGISTDDLGEGTESIFSKSADDNKLGVLNCPRVRRPYRGI